MEHKRRVSVNFGGDAAQLPRNPIAALHEAIRTDTVERVKELLDSSDSNQPKQDVLAIALSIAASRGRLDATQLLLDEGADPNAAVKGRPTIPLVRAVEACQRRSPPRPRPPSVLQQPLARQAVADSPPSEADLERLCRLERERIKQEQLKEDRMKQEELRIQREDRDRHAIVELLLQHGANPDVIDSRRRTPLMIAKTTVAAKMLIDKQADVNATDEDDMTPLMHARSLDLVELLLEHGAELAKWDSQHRTPLIVSIIEDDKPDIVAALIRQGADIEFPDSIGRTPLITAVWKNREDVVKLLLDTGANVSKRDSRGRNVLHHYAADSNRRVQPDDGPGPRIFNLLLSKAEDGDLKIKDHHLRTPLHWAAATGNFSAATAILERPGAVVDPVERKRKTPLHLIVRLGPSIGDGDPDKVLSDAGSISESANPSNLTKRQQEAMRKQQKIREKAMQEDVSRRSELRRRIIGLTTLLVQHKADVHAESEGGWTPLHIACQEQKMVEVIALLLSQGALLNQRIHTGKTPLHIVRLENAHGMS